MNLELAYLAGVITTFLFMVYVRKCGLPMQHVWFVDSLVYAIRQCSLWEAVQISILWCLVPVGFACMALGNGIVWIVTRSERWWQDLTE